MSLELKALESSHLLLSSDDSEFGPPLLLHVVVVSGRGVVATSSHCRYGEWRPRTRRFGLRRSGFESRDKKKYGEWEMNGRHRPSHRNYEVEARMELLEP